jgi:VWFA-related protein
MARADRRITLKSFRNPLVVGSAVLLAATLLAQSSEQQRPPNVMPKLMESVDVRVINVDVVVTDKKGTQIHGLKKDDFLLYENGVPKKLTNFYEVQGTHAIDAEGATVGTPPAATTTATVPAREEIPEHMRRRIIFFVDNLTLAPFNRNRVFKEMKEFAVKTMRPGDEAMIATYNRSMKIRVPFTRDAVQIQQALDGIAGESALGLSNKSELQQTEDRIRDAQSYDDAVATARSYAQSVEHDVRQAVASLNGLMSTLAGVEGKKILVLTSEGFQLSPGKEAFYFIDDVAKDKTNWQQAGSSMIESMNFNATSLIQEVAKTANANGITLYTIHAGGLAAMNDNSAENSKPISFSVQQAGLSNSTDSLSLMADMTGGLATLSTNNYAQAFDRIARDLDSYYSLGYRAGTERVDRQRNLEVRLKDNSKGYTARARQTFVEKSTFAEMSDRVIANLLYKTKSNDLHIIVRRDQPVALDDGNFKVPVEIQIPMESLTLIPQGEIYAGGFSVYVAVANKDNDMSDVTQRQHQIRVPPSDLEKLKGKYYAFSMELVMERGLNRISIGVVDDITNTTGFAREQVIAQDLR